jgi:hypothetical protein
MPRLSLQLYYECKIIYRNDGWSMNRISEMQQFPFKLCKSNNSCLSKLKLTRPAEPKPASAAADVTKLFLVVVDVQVN